MKKVILIAAAAAVFSSGVAQAAKPTGGNVEDSICVEYKDFKACYEWDAAMKGNIKPKLFDKGLIQKGLVDPKIIIPKDQLKPIILNK